MKMCMIVFYHLSCENFQQIWCCYTLFIYSPFKNVKKVPILYVEHRVYIDRYNLAYHSIEVDSFVVVDCV
jgi:hypothetical protein